MEDKTIFLIVYIMLAVFTMIEIGAYIYDYNSNPFHEDLFTFQFVKLSVFFVAFSSISWIYVQRNFFN